MSKITRQKRKDNFTVVNNDILQNSKISWAAKGMLVYLLHLPDGWQINVADLWNRSKNGRDASAAIIKELIQAGYVTRTKVKGEKNLFKGYDYTVSDEPTVNWFPVDGKSVFGDSVNGNPEASKDYQKEELSEERTKEKNEQLPKEEIEKPNKQLQFVSEVVAYLNQKTNQQFKETTKETIQFINSRVKLDGWELEDFKAVIDFKTNEWLKDDKMRQYLCPSTLFRASNAEKYLLAAKASKPKSPVQKQYPTKVHVEQPVLTQQDIEASEQHFAGVRAMFKQMGV